MQDGTPYSKGNEFLFEIAGVQVSALFALSGASGHFLKPGFH